MTLAVFLLIAAWMTSPQSSQATTPASTQSVTEPSNPTPEKQDQTQSNTPPANASEAKPQVPPATRPQQRHRRKKKQAAVNCDTASAALPSASNANTTNSGSAANDPATPTPGTATPAKNCPPTKIIVRHGGTSEPSIQLAPSTDQAAKQRDVVKQLLGATDANLKRIAGKQLNANQQNMLGQIRDYEQQSRAAMSDGDLERARTLAWKAELLSEDLTKPQK